MFESMYDKLSGIFEGLTRRGALTEDDVKGSMREVRRALLEADVSLEVARSFIDKVRTRVVGAEVVKSVTPGQMVIKIVNDVLIDTLGENADTISLEAAPPVAIMMVGLQGAGKTTPTAKLAKRLKARHKSRVLMAALDGIQTKTRPGDPIDKDVYDLKPEELAGVPDTPRSLEDSLLALQNDHEFLLRGDVFTSDIIATWIWYKQTYEIEALRVRPHPFEFTLYYDI